MRVPALIRKPLAFLIARLREKGARKIYAQLGGQSPILANSFAQAAALEDRLNDISKNHNKVLVGMLYAPPFISEAVQTLQAYGAQEIILLPLYPQYSTTTNEPALKKAVEEIRKAKRNEVVKIIDRFPVMDGLVQAWANAIQKAAQGADKEKTRILFSAHGLPEKMVREGDPYPQECQATIEEIVKRLDPTFKDWRLCYQSKVGPVKWIGPSTESEIQQAAREDKQIIVAPIAFVCDHAETLYELDIYYREKAARWGAPFYAVARPPGTEAVFINNLAAQIEAL